MELTTTYLGLNLRSPLVVAASPLSHSIDSVRRIEDAGAGAIVLFSLFEEQIRAEQQGLTHRSFHRLDTPTEIQTLLKLTPLPATLDSYLAHIQKAKEAVRLPIIASLNCTALGTWVEFAQKIEQAGADALELNFYFIPTDADMTADHVEEMIVHLVKIVKTEIHIPVAVKLSPFFTNMANVARRLDRAGAGALVLFNRFYQPDFDPKTLGVQPSVVLSTSADSRLPMHWIAILYRHVRADLAASGGIHTAEDVVKLLMVGAKVTMLASALLKEGIDYLPKLETALIQWMDQNNYSSVDELRGLLNRFHSTNLEAFERAEYMQALASFKLPEIAPDDQDEAITAR
jgi:dihydroorotate dehydrogenase (fumarate)